MNIDRVLAMTPCPRGARVTFCGQEDGSWVIEIDASPQGGILPQRIRITFEGVVQARLNSPEEITNENVQVLSVQATSPWLRDFERDYIARFGPKLLVVIKDVRHFVVKGQDLSIGLLARKVTCEEKQ